MSKNRSAVSRRALQSCKRIMQKSRNRLDEVSAEASGYRDELNKGYFDYRSNLADARALLQLAENAVQRALEAEQFIKWKK